MHEKDFRQFPRNNTYVRNPFACTAVLQSMWKGPNHCWNIMESRYESATYIVPKKIQYPKQRSTRVILKCTSIQSSVALKLQRNNDDR